MTWIIVVLMLVVVVALVGFLWWKAGRADVNKTSGEPAEKRRWRDEGRISGYGDGGGL